MKFFSLHLDSPCPEDVSNMKTNASGFFCDLCTKQVLDLTKMTPEEILNLLNKSNGNICASVTKEQLQTPIIYFDKPKPVSKLPYSKLAAGIILATSLTNPPNLEAQNYSPYIQTELNTPILHKDHEYIEQQMPLTSKEITIHGKVVYESSQKPIEHVKVSYITLGQIFTSYTNSSGEFLLKIPKKHIKEKNIIRLNYHHIKRKYNEPIIPLSNTNYIISEKELGKNIHYNATFTGAFVGHLRATKEVNLNDKSPFPAPIVLYNGVEISYREYDKMKYKRYNKYNLSTKTHFHFNPEIAQILFGPRAEHGLHLFFD